jgi:hypothetical protein
VVAPVGVNHRGRHQAQGNDIGDKSRPWARPLPYPAEDGHADLSTLAEDIGEAAREKRELCFKQAHRFIRSAHDAGGVGPVSKSFPAGRPGEQTTIRVDIEVKKGMAFV